MITRRSVTKNSALLTVAQAAAYGMSFVRNVIVARLVEPEDFGIAAMFAVTVSLLEMASDFAWDRFLIQAPDGEDERLLGVSHLLVALRGLMAAAIIVALAGPIAALFDVPQAAWAFRVLAVIPLLNGLNHLDRKRVQRRLRYGPDAGVDLVSQSVTLAMAWPLAYELGDYSAMLWLVVIRAAVQLAGSHVVASSAYHWTWDASVARRAVRFGWPLALVGILMFAFGHGQRAIIGAAYSMTDVGCYSVALALVTVLAQLVARVNAAVLLPLLARTQDDREAFIQSYRRCMEILCFLAATSALLFVLLGHWLIVTVYGRDYALAGAVVGWLGAAQALWLLRVGATQAAIARGDTMNPLMSNIARAVIIAAMIAVAVVRMDLTWIAVFAFVGEAIGLATALWLARRRHQIAMNIALTPALIFAAPVLLAAVFQVVSPDAYGLWHWFAAAAMLGVMLLIAVNRLDFVFADAGRPWRRAAEPGLAGESVTRDAPCAK